VRDAAAVNASATLNVESVLLATACGRAAERRLTGLTNQVGGFGDQRREVDLMLRFGYGTDEELSLKMRLPSVQARRFVEEHWQQICDVAEAVLERAPTARAKKRGVSDEQLLLPDDETDERGTER
jgi:hypothetical protein